LESIPYQSRATLEVQLVHHTSAVGLYSFHAEVELIGDLLIGVAQRYQAQHLALTLALEKEEYKKTSPRCTARMATASSVSTACLST
jgi:hypothetical protein